MVAKLYRPDAAQLTTISAAGFGELAATPAFQAVRWLTATYYTTIKTLSAYGSDPTTDHRLVITEVDRQDEKRVVEILAAMRIVSDYKVRRTLETRRLWLSFTHRSLRV